MANDWSHIDGDRHPGQLVANDEAPSFADIDELSELLHRRLLRTGAGASLAHA